ncbi:MAG: hypothetical protein U0441_00280 [Polyangiaceae bacterium]
MTAEEEEATERLLFHLENQTGFWFGLVVGDDPAPRERLCEAARKWCEEHGRAFYLHSDDPNALLALPILLAENAQAGVHWIRADGVSALVESWHTRAAQMLMAMNERREAYRARLDGGVVVEGRSSLKRILREMAPDMFSIRAFIIEPGEGQERRAKNPPEWRPPSAEELRNFRFFDPERTPSLTAELTAFVSGTPFSPQSISELLAIPRMFARRQWEDIEAVARRLISWSDEQACAGHPINPRFEGLVYAILGTALMLRGSDPSEARSALERADKVFSNLEETPDGYSRPVLHHQVLRLKADLAAESGNFQAAKNALERNVALLEDARWKLTEVGRLELVESLTSLHQLISREGWHDPELAAKAFRLAQEGAATWPDDDRWKLELVGTAVLVAGSSLDANPEDFSSALATLLPLFDTAVSVEKHESSTGYWKNVLLEYYSFLAVLIDPEDEPRKAVVIHAIEWTIPRRAAALLASPGAEPTGVWLMIILYMKLARAYEPQDTARARAAIREAMTLITNYPPQNEDQMMVKHQVESLRAFVESGPKSS